MMSYLAQAMTSEGASHPAAEAVVRAYIAALNAHDLEAAYGLVASDCLRHIGWREVRFPDAPGQSPPERSWRACPDWRYDVQAIVAAGDLVALMVRASGTHTGGPQDLPGWGSFPATGRPLRAAWSCVYRVSAGKIVEQWQTIDSLLTLGDLGALPTNDRPARQFASNAE